MIEDSELVSGFLLFSQQVPSKRPALALGLGLLPGGGSFYTNRDALGLVNAFLYPFSILWDGPLGFFAARKARREVRVTVTFVDLGGLSEIRTGFSTEEVDGDYAITLDRLYAEIQRQVMLRRHRDRTLGSGARLRPSFPVAPPSPAPAPTGAAP